jgi:hypothetical protein
MKKKIYMVCIMLIQVILGILICKTRYSALYAIPIGALTGVLFCLFENECSKKK